MAVQTFEQPDFTSQTATEYKNALDSAASIHNKVAGDFAPHQSDPAAMTVTLDAGKLFMPGGTSLVEQAAQTTGTITAPSSNPRIDRIVIDMVTGAVSVITGSEAASPSAPDITPGKLPVAQVLLQTSSTSITNSMLTDERTWAISSRAHRGAKVYLSSNQSIAAGGPDIIDFDSEDYDTDGIHEGVTNPSRLTVPSGVTKIKLSCGIYWGDNTETSRYRIANFMKNTGAMTGNGASPDYQVTVISSQIVHQRINSSVIEVTAGDYFEVRVEHTATSAINVNGGSGNSWFAMEIIE